MKSFVILVSLLFISTNAFDIDEEDYTRVVRASAGAYGGVVNGQHFGGTYYTPENGPTVHQRFGDHGSGGSSNSNRNKPNLHNRFGDEPSGSHNRPSGGSGSFAGAAAGGFSGSGSGPNYGNPAPYYPFQGPDAQPFRTPFEFYDFLQNFFSTFNNNLASTFQKNMEIQRNAFDAAMQAFNSAANQRFGGAPNINYGAGGGAAFSSASYGPGGGHQSAGVYPENHSRPNIHTRFGDDDSRPNKSGGSVGISTSAFSSSSDINGKKTSRKQATTSINENGRVTTYTVDD